MKFKITVLFLFVTKIILGQSFCPPNGISTNPGNPINPQQTNYLNHFDWTTTNPFYPINSQCNPNAFTPNPFQSNQLELLPLSLTKDMKPENGWEMVAYNLGFDNNNNPLLGRPEHTYVMMYNKYTGKLRILVKWCRNVNYNGAMLTLKFAPGFQTNLLDMANVEKALNTPHVQNPSMSTALKFYNDNNSWAYAEFKMNYDPCTCSFPESSRLLLYSELISNSSVELTGKITGTITSISGGQGAASSDGSFWKSANNINDKMMKVHTTTQKFINGYEKIYTDLADGGITINAIKTLGNSMKESQFLKAGLKALPYVSKAVNFLEGLFGGGLSGSGPLEIAPLSVNLDVRIQGTIATQDPMHNQTIGLPGSQMQGYLPGTTGGQPLYNEAMGIFSLINAPVMYYTETSTTKEFINREKVGLSNPKYLEIKSLYNFVDRNYKLSGDALKYAINPASGLMLQDAEVMLITEYVKPAIEYSKANPNSTIVGVDVDMNNGLEIAGTTKGPLVDEAASVFQNAFKPIGIKNYKNDYSFTYTYSVTPKLGSARRLDYYPNATPKFSCYGGVSEFSCNWLTGYMRLFSYNQKMPIANSFSFLDLSHFRDNYNVESINPNLITPKDEFLAPRIKGFKLKFVLNLKRTDNPDAQNVLYVVTYPVELKPAPVGYNMTGSNYITDAQAYAAQGGFNPAVPTNKVIPVTQAELATICAATAYKNNRMSTSGKMAREALGLEMAKENNTDVKPLLYPVPVKERLNIESNDNELLSIVDFYGKTVYTFESNTNQDKGQTLSVDVSRFAAGVYMMTYRNQSGELKSIKFTIE
ncbi:T9SS type A sorting domain-containing protein [Flavobacterium supellecticarium]|uniref:T9SS type A sorting domain-containing protein n=1 Tax=Flavobacterium supellecticarium TaxID=2565924 RepID=A0A4S3ZZG2_9FLAO|nr:T9SS type A sorting domain-containing protein [Flavobacterium supellecticarium]THF51386.1 T9SS type A sorting domain-containing protein [Flavobacterium supellecticarium]